MSEPLPGQRLIQRIYSAAARRVYEPVVVKGSFRVFGGDLHRLLADQTPSVVDAAGGGPILDIPIGTAYFTEAVARAHPGMVVGADIAAGMTQKAASVARGRGFPLSLVQADIHRLPFPDGSFPVVLCTNGLQVIPGLTGALRELARLLAPGGTMFTSVITLPLSKVARRSRLPTMLRSGDDIAAEIAATGLRVDKVIKERLATLIEATKPGF